MPEDNEAILLEDIKKDAREHKFGFISYRLIIHQGKITGYEELERKKVRRL